uniref:(northern house mosquito) hypothetical protein n=1 Tax=Culex pipiens TaxID=7175 RepID=A0A8D8JQ08_CULPI
MKDSDGSRRHWTTVATFGTECSANTPHIFSHSFGSLSTEFRLIFGFIAVRRSERDNAPKKKGSPRWVPDLIRAGRSWARNFGFARTVMMELCVGIRANHEANTDEPDGVTLAAISTDEPTRLE